MDVSGIAVTIAKWAVGRISTKLAVKLFPFNNDGLIIRDLRGSLFQKAQNVLDLSFYFVIQNFSGYDVEIQYVCLRGRKNSDPLFVLSVPEHYVIAEKAYKDCTISGTIFPGQSDIIVNKVKTTYNPNEIGVSLEVNFKYDKIVRTVYVRNDMFPIQANWTS